MGTLGVDTLYLKHPSFLLKLCWEKYWIGKIHYLIHKTQTVALRQAEKSKNVPPYRISLSKHLSHAELSKTEVTEAKIFICSLVIDPPLNMHS